jgi:hypothetical protein
MNITPTTPPELPDLATCQDWVTQADQLVLGQFSNDLEALAVIARCELAGRAWRQKPRTYRSAA